MSNAQDVVFAMVMVFVFGLGFFIIHYGMTTTVTQITSHPVINASNQSVESFNAITTKVTSRLDYLIFGLMMAFMLGFIIVGFYVGGVPIFMFIYFLVTAVGVAISALLANVWESVSTASVFGTTLNAFPITNHIILHFPIYVSIMGFIGIVAMFAKPYFASQ